MEDTPQTFVRVPIHLNAPDKVRMVGFSLTLRQFGIMAVAVVLAFFALLPAYQAFGWFGLVGVGLEASLFGCWAFQPIEGRYLEGWVRALWQYVREPHELVWKPASARLATPKQQKKKGPVA